MQVGFRAGPDDRPDQQFLLDVSVPGADRDPEDAFDEQQALAVLEPVLHAGTGAPRHYSLHLHRWHTSWGLNPNALDLGLLVTTGARGTAATAQASHDSVTRAFRDLMRADRAAATRRRPPGTPRSCGPGRAAATAYRVDPDAMSLSAEEHHPADNAWTLRMRTTAGDAYEVVVGVVDGYAGSVRVRHEERIEVADSIGAE